MHGCPLCTAGLTNADQRITEDVEKFSFAIAELVRPVPAARLAKPPVDIHASGFIFIAESQSTSQECHMPSLGVPGRGLNVMGSLMRCVHRDVQAVLCPESLVGRAVLVHVQAAAGRAAVHAQPEQDDGVPWPIRPVRVLRCQVRLGFFFWHTSLRTPHRLGSCEL